MLECSHIILLRERVNESDAVIVRVVTELMVHSIVTRSFKIQ